MIKWLDYVENAWEKHIGFHCNLDGSILAYVYFTVQTTRPWLSCNVHF